MLFRSVYQMKVRNKKKKKKKRKGFGWIKMSRRIVLETCNLSNVNITNVGDCLYFIPLLSVSALCMNATGSEMNLQILLDFI